MKDTLLKAAKLAGKVMLKHYGKIRKITFKESKKSLLTKVDLKAEKVIIDTIKKKFPDHNIICEESGTKDNNSPYTWIIDPVDGTTNYSQGIPDFCTSIGLQKDDKIVMGAVYAPIRRELFFAEIGKGAYLNNKKINVSKKDKVIDSILGFSLPSLSSVAVNSLHIAADIFPKVRAIRNTGSAAINLCNVACARYDYYFSQSIHPWDAAAGAIILKEAGGKVTGMKGEEWKVGSIGISASNKILHPKFARILKKR